MDTRRGIGPMSDLPSELDYPTAKPQGPMDRLIALGSCTVADALVRLDGGKGCLTDFQMYSPGAEYDPGRQTSIAGPVYTVKRDRYYSSRVRLVRPEVNERYWRRGLIRGGTKSACWGGLLTSAAIRKGIQGVIIDGACRDLKEHKDFPVFARSHSVLGQGSSTRVSELGCPLTVRPLQPEAAEPFPPLTIVETEYIALADVDGVVIIDNQMLGHTLDLAEKLQARDEETQLEIKMGGTVEDAFKATRPGYKVDA